MAYMSQETKKQIHETLKPILKKYGVKATVAVNNRSTLVLNIKSGPIDFIDNTNKMSLSKYMSDDHRLHLFTDYIQVNEYWYKDHFSGDALAFLSEIIPAMNAGNHDNSDIQTDYFDVGFYIDVNIGKWDSPYQLTK